MKCASELDREEFLSGLGAHYFDKEIWLLETHVKHQELLKKLNKSKHNNATEEKMRIMMIVK